MDSPSVTLQSVTGVDVELRIAGPGSRSYAFVIDWHIRLTLALGWFFGALMLFGGLGRLLDDVPDPGLYFFFLVKVAPLAIYFLYHPVLEVAMHGRTPGKRMAGIRIVSRSGNVPGTGALLVRNVFRLVDSLPFVYLVGLASTIFTQHNVRIGDIAAGTLLVHDTTESEKSFEGLRAAANGGGLNPQSADLAQELLDRWDELDQGNRVRIARSLLARIDPAASGESLALRSAEELRAHLVDLLTHGKAA